MWKLKLTQRQPAATADAMLERARGSQSSAQALDAILKFRYEARVQQVLAMRLSVNQHREEALKSDNLNDPWSRALLLHKLGRGPVPENKYWSRPRLEPGPLL